MKPRYGSRNPRERRCGPRGPWAHTRTKGLETQGARVDQGPVDTEVDQGTPGVDQEAIDPDVDQGGLGIPGKILRGIGIPDVYKGA